MDLDGTTATLLFPHVPDNGTNLKVALASILEEAQKFRCCLCPRQKCLRRIKMKIRLQIAMLVGPKQDGSGGCKKPPLNNNNPNSVKYPPKVRIINGVKYLPIDEVLKVILMQYSRLLKKFRFKMLF
jgi:hypothetical protein